MSQFSAKFLVYFLFLAAFVGLGDCWSTTVTQKCVTKSQKNPDKKPSTVTVTKTRYVEQIVTETLTPTDVVALSTTTITLSGTAVVATYTGTTTIFETITDPLTYYTEAIVNSTTTEIFTVTEADTTTTITPPSGFTPASANPTTTANPPIGPSFGYVIDGVAVTAAADVCRVVCTEKYILSTTVTVNVTGPTMTVTESSAAATSYVDALSTSTVSVQASYFNVSYTFPYIGTSTIATITELQVSATTTTINVPTATAYAACAADNLITTIGNYSIGGFVASQSPLEVNVTDAYSCCASCFEMGGCTGSVFFAAETSVGSSEYGFSCFLFTTEIGHKCKPAKKDGWAYWANDYVSDYDTWTVSNGPCGRGYLTEEE